MINFAHRGASGYYPENTMISFRKAVEMNCTGIETDVQMTRDGVLVLMHDEKINRTTDGVGYIKDHTYRELQKLDAGSWLDKSFKNACIPLAEELLQYAKQKNIIVNFELKTNLISYENIEKKLIELINITNMKDKVIVSSFNRRSLIMCKEVDETIKTALLYKRRFSRPEKLVTSLIVDAIHPPFQAISGKKFVNNLKDKGYMVNAWTVNSYEYMRFLVDSGVDGIITNFPDILNEILESGCYKLAQFKENQ